MRHAPHDSKLQPGRTADESAALRGVFAVAAGFAVYLLLGAVATFPTLAGELLGDTAVDDTGPAFLAMNLGSRVLGAFLGGMATARLARTKPRRHAEVLAGLLVIFSIPDLLRGEVSRWNVPTVAVLVVIAAVAGGIMATASGESGGRRRATLRRSPGRPPESRAGQLVLAVFFLLSSTTIAVGFGHGGMVLGLALFLWPMAAVIAAVVSAAVIAAAVMLDSWNFAVVCTIAAFPVIAGLLMIWNSEGFQLFTLASAVPFLAFWIGIVARAMSRARAQAIGD